MSGRASSEVVEDITEGPILISRDGNVHVTRSTAQTG